jgi:hypothetical protein
MDKFLGNYTIEELVAKLELEKNKKEANKYVPFLIEKGTFYHEYRDVGLISGEEFIDFPEFTEVKVSNLGRVMYKGEILSQEPESERNYDYLWVKVPSYKWIKVYELVAKTFLLKDNTNPQKYRIIHHISNNGFDNRAVNLLYVTCEQHADLHNFGSKFCTRNKKYHECDINCKYYNDFLRDKLMEVEEQKTQKWQPKFVPQCSTEEETEEKFIKPFLNSLGLGKSSENNK